MPTNVRNFFWLNVLSLLLGVITATLTAHTIAAMATAAGHGPDFVIVIRVFVVVVMLLILWLIAFKRQNWARWLWLALFVLGTPGYIGLFKNLFGISLAGAISLAQVALQIVALYLVFTGNAAVWFRREPDVADAV
jgi:hypothetical protein